MIEERKTLPESVGGLFDTAFAMYGRRFGLYTVVALLGFGAQAVCAELFATLGVHGDDPIFVLQSIVAIFVDAFIVGVVAIGVIADLSVTEANAQNILASALERWPSLIAVSALIAIIMVVPQQAVAESGVGSFFLYVLPVAALSGAIVFATVACAADASILGLRIIGSFAQSIRIALFPTNFGRAVIIGIATLVPLLVQAVLLDQFSLRHVRGTLFWANVPVDVLSVGPLEAVFAVFYIDFVRRLKAAEANR